MILAIDTATSYAGLALYDDDGLHSELTWRAPRQHTTQVAARLAQMLALAGLTIPGLHAIAVTLGPGSFAGLRVGLALAKGLALPNNIPVVGVPTLDVVAYPHQQSPVPVWAVVQAGRSRIGAACFGRRDGGWQETVAPQLMTVPDLLASIDEPVWLTGELSQADEALVRAALRDNRPKAITLVPPALRLRRPGVLAELGAQRLTRHDHDLTPLYLKSPT
jgi:tRNA threonylcarbamoyladenosine biosynthesis protein TsaB